MFFLNNYLIFFSYMQEMMHEIILNTIEVISNIWVDQ